MPRLTGSERRATRIVAFVGRAFGLVLVGAGLVLATMGDIGNGVMLLLTGWFLTRAARAGATGRPGGPAGRGSRRRGDGQLHSPIVAPQLTLENLRGAVPPDRRCDFAAGRSRRLAAGRDRHQPGRGAFRAPRWSTTRAGDATATPPALPTLAPEDELLRAVERLAMDRSRRPAGDARHRAAWCADAARRGPGVFSHKMFRGLARRDASIEDTAAGIEKALDRRARRLRHRRRLPASLAMDYVLAAQDAYMTLPRGRKASSPAFPTCGCRALSATASPGRRSCTAAGSTATARKAADLRRGGAAG